MSQYLRQQKPHESKNRKTIFNSCLCATLFCYTGLKYSSWLTSGRTKAINHFPGWNCIVQMLFFLMLILHEYCSVGNAEQSDAIVWRLMEKVALWNSRLIYCLWYWHSTWALVSVLAAPIWIKLLAITSRKTLADGQNSRSLANRLGDSDAFAGSYFVLPNPVSWSHLGSELAVGRSLSWCSF